MFVLSTEPKFDRAITSAEVSQARADLEISSAILETPQKKKQVSRSAGSDPPFLNLHREMVYLGISFSV